MKHGASCSLGNKREVPYLPAHKDYVAPWILNSRVLLRGWLMVVVVVVVVVMMMMIMMMEM
jgi:hypothetical protein